MAKIYSAPKKIRLMKSVVKDKLEKKQSSGIIHRTNPPNFKTRTEFTSSRESKAVELQKIKRIKKIFKKSLATKHRFFSNSLNKSSSANNYDTGLLYSSSTALSHIKPLSDVENNEETEDTGTQGIKTAVGEVSKLQKSTQKTIVNVSSLKTKISKSKSSVNDNKTQTTQSAAKEKANKKAKATQKVQKQSKKAKEILDNKLPKGIFPVNGFKVIMIVLLLLIGLIIYTALSNAVLITGIISGTTGWLFHDEGETEKSNDELVKKVEKYYELCNDALDIKKNDAVHILDEAVDDDYIGLNGNTYYPAESYKATVAAAIQNADIDIADLIAVLYVKIQKDKGEEFNNNEIYNFKLTKEDIEDFLGKVNESPKYLNFRKNYQTGLACPGQNCKIEYRNDRCAYYYTDEGYIRYYCAGHPYCDYHHNMVSITFEKNEDIMDELGFTEDDKSRVTMIMEMVKSISESKAVSS